MSKGKDIGNALNDWSGYLQDRFPIASYFHRYLYSLNIQVDDKTAARWYDGETLPSTVRIIEMIASGFNEPYRVIFEHASLAGDREARVAKVAEIEEHIAALQRQLKDLQNQP